MGGMPAVTPPWQTCICISFRFWLKFWLRNVGEGDLLHPRPGSASCLAALALPQLFSVKRGRRPCNEFGFPQILSDRPRVSAEHRQSIDPLPDVQTGAIRRELGLRFIILICAPSGDACSHTAITNCRGAVLASRGRLESAIYMTKSEML